ncbi:hypothetical protein EDB84DRAFT_1436849 [Lactarius hengduanensis]|nr:hypothetical protein EDB84DRAFT_1436849 [Lactarius hengduanensis]
MYVNPGILIPRTPSKIHRGTLVPSFPYTHLVRPSGLGTNLISDSSPQGSPFREAYARRGPGNKVPSFLHCAELMSGAVGAGKDNLFWPQPGATVTARNAETPPTRSLSLDETTTHKWSPGANMEQPLQGSHSGAVAGIGECSAFLPSSEETALRVLATQQFGTAAPPVALCASGADCLADTPSLDRCTPTSSPLGETISPRQDVQERVGRRHFFAGRGDMSGVISWLWKNCLTVYRSRGLRLGQKLAVEGLGEHEVVWRE